MRNVREAISKGAGIDPANFGDIPLTERSAKKQRERWGKIKKTAMNTNSYGVSRYSSNGNESEGKNVHIVEERLENLTSGSANG